MKFVCSREASLFNSNCIKNLPLSILGINSVPTNPVGINEQEPIKRKNTKIIVFHLLANTHTNRSEKNCVKRLRYPSNPIDTFPNRELELACSNFPKREYSQGTTVNDISNDSIVAMATVIQNSLTIFTTMLFPIEIGTNTTTITKVIAITVSTISLDPSKAARTLFLPISI